MLFFLQSLRFGRCKNVVPYIGFFTGAPQAMYDGLMGFVGMLAGFGSAVLDGIMAPFNMMGKNIAEAASKAWDSFKGVFRIGSPSKAAEEVGGQIVDGFAGGTEDLDSSIKGPSQKPLGHPGRFLEVLVYRLWDQ